MTQAWQAKETRRPVFDVARTLLERELAAGPQPVQRLYAAARAASVGQATLYRAARALGVVRSGSQFQRAWALPAPAPAVPRLGRDVRLWLLGYLLHGAQPALQTLDDARAAGFAEDELYDAVVRLGIQRGWVTVDGRTRWCFRWDAPEDLGPAPSLPTLLPVLYDRYRALIERDSGGARDWLSWQVAVGAVLADLFDLAGAPLPRELNDYGRRTERAVIALRTLDDEDEIPF